MREIARRLSLFLPLLLLLLSNHASWAQGASVTGATMTWYGVYTAATSSSVSSTKEIGTGIKPPATNGDRFSLPASGSILFGYGYKLTGSPPTALVAFTYRTLFPDGHYQDNIYDGLAINRQDLFIGQRLNSDSATGTYTLQLWHSGGMLLEKTFTVSSAAPGSAVTPAPSPAPGGSQLTRSSCWVYKGDKGDKRTLCFFDPPRVTMNNYNVTTTGNGWSTCDWTGKYTLNGTAITLAFADKSGKCSNGASSPKTTATCEFSGVSLPCKGSTVISGQSYDLDLVFQ